jgi:hypothetical protein
MSKPAPFSSQCPKCKHERLQDGYPDEELIQLLRAGADVEAYCINCDESWSISTDNRADLVSALNR